jgi:arabinogalactan endo-1,4-beta-galactosidase
MIYNICISIFDRNKTNVMIVRFLFLFVIAFLINTGCKKPEDNNGNSGTKQDSLRYDISKLIVGADLSYVNAIEDFGGKYFDSLGKKVDPFVFLHSQGTNLVRVRLWNNPIWQNNLYGSIKYSNIIDVARTIQRAKDAGMSVLLDLHYSDNWADPAKQETPAAWKNLTLSVMKDSIYQYTTSVLNHLKGKNLTPEFIQIGNENNSGICHPAGKISNNNFNNFAQLISSGIAAVRSFSTTSSVKPKIILHVAQLQDAVWWTKGVITDAAVTDFDILGISHYFLWSTVNNNKDITATIADITARYKKPVLIIETAFPWTTDSNDAYGNIISGQNNTTGYSVSKEGQLKYMTDLNQAIIDGGGIGTVYWEPCWISSNLKDQWGTGSSWENNTFFDFTGKPLPVVKYMKYRYKFK